MAAIASVSSSRDNPTRLRRPVSSTSSGANCSACFSVLISLIPAGLFQAASLADLGVALGESVEREGVLRSDAVAGHPRHHQMIALLHPGDQLPVDARFPDPHPVAVH